MPRGTEVGKLHDIDLHGHRVFFRAGGSGPVLVLVHGITSTSETWSKVLPYLAERFTVIAPDLLGHGESAKPRGDYSLGAYASGIRWSHSDMSARRSSGTHWAAAWRCSSPTSSPSTATAWCS